MLSTNEVNPEGFLREARQVNNNAFERKAIDSDVKHEEAPGFLQSLYLWG